MHQVQSHVVARLEKRADRHAGRPANGAGNPALAEGDSAERELLGEVIELVPPVVGTVSGRIGDFGEGEEAQHDCTLLGAPELQESSLDGGQYDLQGANVTAYLAGISVLDLSVWRPGPYATSLLAHLGADVVKIEPPGGDPMRHYPELFDSVNAGKRSMVLDLKAAPDLASALALVAEADVLVEGFRPGVMARLGLGYDFVHRLNPALVYCSISGYGQTGERALLPGHDVNYQAWAGALSPDGGTAALPPLPVADLASGLTAAFGICAALVGGAGVGSGPHLDVSMTDVMSTWTGSARAVGSEPASTADPASVPGYGLFRTADGAQVALGVVNEQHFWIALCGELGLEELSPVPFAERIERAAELNLALVDAIALRRQGELVTALALASVPVAPVLDRAALVASAPFPPFPIRLPESPSHSSSDGPTPRAPQLDEHRGQGFLRFPPESSSE